MNEELIAEILQRGLNKFMLDPKKKVIHHDAFVLFKRLVIEFRNEMDLAGKPHRSIDELLATCVDGE